MNLPLLMNKISSLDKKIKIMIVIFLVAITLFFIPSKPSSKVVKNQNTNIENLKRDTEKELSTKLSKLVGVSHVNVMITYENDGEIYYVSDDKVNSQNEEGKKTSLQMEKKTVLDGGKNIIVKSRLAPKIKGVCVFYQGDESLSVVENLYNATKGGLGVELHKIEVIKTK